jgi:hypothetical protein
LKSGHMLNEAANLTNLVVAVVALVLVIWTFVHSLREAKRIVTLEEEVRALRGMAKRNAHNSKELHFQLLKIIESTNLLHVIAALQNDDPPKRDSVNITLLELSGCYSNLEKLNLEWRLFDGDQQLRTEAQNKLIRGVGDVQTLRLFEGIARGDFGFEDDTISRSRNELYVRLGNENGYPWDGRF